MNDITTTAEAGLQLRQVERMTASLPPLRGRYPSSRAEVDLTRDAIRRLDTKASERWIGQRIVTLLSHYFVVDAHPGAMSGIAADWQRELSGYPAWAIDAACNWWTSKDNQKRRQKPVPGDISEQAHKHAQIIRSGQKMIEAFEKFGDHPPAFLAR